MQINQNSSFLYNIFFLQIWNWFRNFKKKTANTWWKAGIV